METAQQFIHRKEQQFDEEKEKQQTIKMKDIGRREKLIFMREAWTFMPQSNLDKKVFVIERFRKVGDGKGYAYRYAWKEGDIEYRFGYYIVGQIGRAENKWWWGQSCPILPEKDLMKLVNKAKRDGTILS